MHKPPDKCWTTYQVKSGYRKTAGNTCTGGVDHSDITLTCPFTSRMLYFRNLFLVLLLGLIVYTFLSFKPEFLERVKSLLPGHKQPEGSKDFD